MNKAHAAKDHGENVHQQYSCKVEQIEAQGAPGVFHGFTQGIIANQADGHEEYITVAEDTGADAGDQSPDLALQNGCPIEAQNVEEGIGAVNATHDVYHRIGDGDIQHQIGDALVTVTETEPLKVPSQSIQWISTPGNVMNI